MRAAFLVSLLSSQASSHPELNPNVTSKVVGSECGPGTLMVSETEATSSSSHSLTCPAHDDWARRQQLVRSQVALLQATPCPGWMGRSGQVSVLVRGRMAFPAEAETHVFPRGYLLEIPREGLFNMLTGKGWFYSPLWVALVEADPYMLRATEPLTLKTPMMVNGALNPRLNVVSLRKVETGRSLERRWLLPSSGKEWTASGCRRRVCQGYMGGRSCLEGLTVPQLLFASKIVAGKEPSTEAKGLQKGQRQGQTGL